MFHCIISMARQDSHEFVTNNPSGWNICLKYRVVQDSCQWSRFVCDIHTALMQTQNVCARRFDPEIIFQNNFLFLLRYASICMSNNYLCVNLFAFNSESVWHPRCMSEIWKLRSIMASPSASVQELIVKYCQIQIHSDATFSCSSRALDHPIKWPPKLESCCEPLRAGNYLRVAHIHKESPVWLGLEPIFWNILSFSHWYSLP